MNKTQKIINIQSPLTADVTEKLRAGDMVCLSGIIYTARDTAHKRMIELLENGKSLPFDVRNQIIYYMGPSPASPGKVIGAAGPTTSYRMDKYAPELIRAGLRGMIGKGKRSAEVIDACIKNKAVYFGATGGAGALISKSIKSSEIIAYPDLGPEAIRILTIENLQLVVINDTIGNDLYDIGLTRYAKCC